MNEKSLDKEFARFHDQIYQTPLSQYNNLSKTKELVAKYKGFDNWHQLEKFFKLKESQMNSDELDIDIRKFTQYSEYLIHSKNPIKTYPKPIKNFKIIDQPHKPCIIGIDIDKPLLRSKNYYSINNYPLYMDGCTGSGISETTISCISQNIYNKEGVILIDNQGEPIFYHKLYSLCEQTNRLEDLYYLNILSTLHHADYKNNTSSNNLLVKSVKKRNVSHTIEPFNILLGDLENFQSIFGETTTKWLFPYLHNLYSKNINISLTSLLDLFSFHNLLYMQDNDVGNQKEVSEYLQQLGLNKNILDEGTLQSLVLNHFIKNHQALDVIFDILFCVENHLFSDDPDIDLENIFLGRKILLIQNPALSKCNNEIIKRSLFINNLIYIAEKNTRKYNIHFQNIYNFEASYSLFNITHNTDLKETKNNYILSFLDFTSFNYATEYRKIGIHFNENSFNSFLLMKNYESNILNKTLFYKYSNLKNFTCFMDTIKKQVEGHAIFVDTINMNTNAIDKNNIIFHSNKNNKDILKSKAYSGDIQTCSIACVYYSPPRVKILSLISHKEPV